MEFIQAYFSTELIYALGWTVVHSLWQGILIALIMAGALIGLQSKSSKLRYEIAGLSLFMVLISALVTFIILYHNASPEIMDHSILISGTTTNLAAMEGTSTWSDLYYNSMAYFNQYLPLIVLVWMLGASLFMLRLMGGLAYIQKLKHQHNKTISPIWQQKMKQLAQKMPLKKSVKVVESALVQVPMVIGYFKPMILIPIAAVNRLSEAEIEAVLAHELAHVVRNDYVLNFCFSFIEILFYYHPAVWWISSSIDAERENCCDDMAIKVCGNSMIYAKTLLSLQELKTTVPQFALPFSTKNKGALINRIKRILNQPQNKGGIAEKLVASFLLIFMVACISVGAATPNKTGETETTLEILDTMDQELRDTIPPKTRRSVQEIKCEKDGKRVALRMKNGEITKLKIDGKTIPPSEYAMYDDFVDELLDEVPVPPAPPATPVPPVPSSFEVPAAPPSPPAPPAPPVPDGLSETRTIFYKDKDGKEVTKTVTINPKASDQKETTGKVVIQDADGLDITINGEKIEVSKGQIVRIGPNSNAVIINKEGKVTKLQTNTDGAVVIETHEGNDLFRADSIAYPKHMFKKAMLEQDKQLEKREQLLAEIEEKLARIEKENHAKMEKTLALRDQLLEDHESKITEAFAQAEISFEQAEIKMQELALEFENPALQFEGLSDFENGEVIGMVRGNDLAIDGNYIQINGFDFSEIEKELVKDGLIESETSYSFEMTNKHMKVNGKKVSKSLYNKYKKIYEQAEGAKFKGKIRVKKNSTSSFIQLDSMNYWIPLC